MLFIHMHNNLCRFTVAFMDIHQYQTKSLLAFDTNQFSMFDLSNFVPLIIAPEFCTTSIEEAIGRQCYSGRLECIQ